MCTEDIVLGKDEFTKPFTWGSEALRSTMRPSPFFVTVARIAMFSMPWPSSSRIASPRYVPSFQPRMVAPRLALGAVEDLVHRLHDRLALVVLDQREQAALAHARRADHRPQIAHEGRAGGARWS